MLVYLAGGFTQARFDQVDFIAPSGLAGLSVPEATYDGWFLGTGYEYKLDWLPGLFWKTEYRYADYGSRTNNIFVTASGGPTALSVDSHKFVQTIRTELVYRFNLR